VDLGAPDSLASLLEFVAANYPSDHLLLVLKGRSAFGEVLRDDDDGDGLDLAGLSTAMSAGLDARGAPVDLLVLASSSSAGIETALATSGLATYLIGTEETTAAPRSMYFRPSVWRAFLRDDWTVAPRDLARRIALNYRDPSYHSFDPSLSYAVSVVDLGLVPTATDLLALDCTGLVARGDAGVTLLESAAAPAWHFGDDGTRTDLGGLLKNLADQDSAAEEPLGLRSRLAIKSAIVENLASDTDALTGVSIFCPREPLTEWSLRTEYRDRFGPFPAETGWESVLKTRLKYHRDRAPSCAAADLQMIAPTIIIMLAAIGDARRRRRRRDACGTRID